MARAIDTARDSPARRLRRARRPASVGRHDAHGYWIEEAGPPTPLAPLDGALDADVVVIGGGYTGMWTAWHLLALQPELRVAVLEGGRFGHGPSGRNGGFVNALWHSLPALRERYGDRAALELVRAAQGSVEAIGRFCSAEGVDAWYRRSGYLDVSASPAQDHAWDDVVAACRELGEPDACVELSPAEVADRCRSPRFRGGILLAGTATVQPARLAFGLRERLAGRGASLFEDSRVGSLRARDGSVEARTARGTVRARAAVLAIGGAVAGRGAPLRRHLTIASSHIALSEPVPDLLEKIGWTGGECITDSRAMLHYLRTTPDGRIAFGWGGGRIALGARLGGLAEVDPAVVATAVAHMRAFFPDLAGRRITHAWGGPIDVSPTHLPVVVELPGGRAFAACGYTGNGVGPSHMVGRTLASLALDRRDAPSRLALVEPRPQRVPPEPLRWLGGVAIRAALERKEEAEDAGRRPHPVHRAMATVPRRLGFRVTR
jgi:glycine/D-amino acid oxidase-like deaminating enzyme